MSDLAREHARIQHGLTAAMNAAQTWHDMMQVAEAMILVDVRYSLMRKEAERHMGDNAPGQMQGYAVTEADFKNATELGGDSILSRRPNGGLG